MNFPKDFKVYFKSPNLKAAFVSEVAAINPRDCRNCGGVGTITVFLAVKGPYSTPSAAPYNTEGESNHFADGWWWKGKSISGPCPDCDGRGVVSPVPQPLPANIRRPVRNLAHDMSRPSILREANDEQ